MAFVDVEIGFMTQFEQAACAGGVVDTDERIEILDPA